MLVVSITEAKARFYELFERVRNGEIIGITRYGKLVVYMVPHRRKS